MKKILICFALAAALLNGVLASVGRGPLSASELQVADIENVAEGESQIGPVLAGIIAGVVVLVGDKAIDYVVDGGSHWVNETKINRYGYEELVARNCVSCNIFSSEGCVLGKKINY